MIGLTHGEMNVWKLSNSDIAHGQEPQTDHWYECNKALVEKDKLDGNGQKHSLHVRANEDEDESAEEDGKLRYGWGCFKPE